VVPARRKCKHCPEQFAPKRPSHVYCSTRCQQRALHQRRNVESARAKLLALKIYLTEKLGSLEALPPSHEPTPDKLKERKRGKGKK
jgi:hypothetical protein